MNAREAKTGSLRLIIKVLVALPGKYSIIWLLLLNSLILEMSVFSCVFRRGMASTAVFAFPYEFFVALYLSLVMLLCLTWPV